MIKLASDFFRLMQDTLPIAIVTMIAVISIRVTYLIKNKAQFVFLKELLGLLFIIYLLMLFQVVTYQDVITYGNNFIPLKELTRYSIGSNLFYKNVVGNILLFTPYGFFISYFLNLDKKRIVFLLTLIISVAIEGVQLIIGRCFDVDDILLNLIGGICGYYIFQLLEYIASKMPKRIIGIIIETVVILVIMFYIYMIM